MMKPCIEDLKRFTPPMLREAVRVLQKHVEKLEAENDALREVAEFSTIREEAILDVIGELGEAFASFKERVAEFSTVLELR